MNSKLIILVIICLTIELSSAGRSVAASPTGEDLDRGSKAFAKQQYSIAEPFLAKAVKAEPSNMDARFLHGSTLLHLNKIPEALVDLKVAVSDKRSSEPHRDLIRHQIASCYAYMGKWKEAIPLFEKLIASEHPANPPLINDLAIAYERSGQKQKALAERKLALRYGYEPSNSSLSGYLAAVNRGDRGNAVLILKDAEQRGTTSPSVLSCLARLNIDQMRYQPAIEELAVCCKTADLCAHYWGDKGNAELLAGKYSDGLNDLNHALNLEPTSPEAGAWRQLRAMCYCGTNNFDAAIQEYNKLIADTKPPSFNYFVDRGKVYARMKLNDKAIADFSKAIACCPPKPLPEILVLRRNTYFSSDKLDLARSDSNKLIAFDNENENYYFFRSYVGIRQGNYKSAVDDLSKAIALDPENASLYYECRADAHFRDGAYQVALDDYSAALKSDQSRSSLYAGRALCYAKLGKQSLAIEQLKTANKFQPKSTANGKSVSPDSHNTDASSTTGLTKLINERRQEVIRMATQAIKV